jgi:hypothetical protein
MCMHEGVRGGLSQACRPATWLPLGSSSSLMLSSLLLHRVLLSQPVLCRCYPRRCCDIEILPVVRPLNNAAAGHVADAGPISLAAVLTAAAIDVFILHERSQSSATSHCAAAAASDTSGVCGVKPIFTNHRGERTGDKFGCTIRSGAGTGAAAGNSHP